MWGGRERAGQRSTEWEEKWRTGSTMATHTGLSPGATHKWTQHRISLTRGSWNIVGTAPGTMERTSCLATKTLVLGPEINLLLL